MGDITKHIPNCVVTGSDAVILKHFVIDKYDDLYKKYSGYNEGILLECIDKYVYNQFDGKVMIVDYDNQRFSIVVQMDSDNCMKYSNLTECRVRKGQYVYSKDLLGKCKKSVKVEYCNTASPNNFPLRVLGTTFYKQNPETVLIANNYKSTSSTTPSEYLGTLYEYSNVDQEVEADGDYESYIPDYYADIETDAEIAKESGDYDGGDI